MSDSRPFPPLPDPFRSRELESVIVATTGDMVLGMASPTQPFVGELGDPPLDAASSVTDPLLASQGRQPPAPPRVTINGKVVSTKSVPAMPLGTPPDGEAPPGRSKAASELVNLGGEGIVRQGDPSEVSSSSVMAILGGNQDFVKVARPATTEDGDKQIGEADGPQQNVPPRASFGDTPTPESILLSRTSPPRRSSLVPSGHAPEVGDPVQIGTGAVVTRATDFASVAPPLTFERRYASNWCERGGSLGYGWSHNLDQRLWLEVGRIVLLEEDGRELEFDCLELPGGVTRAGDVLVDATGRMQLRSMGRFHWELREPGRVRHFGPIQGETKKNRDRGMARLTRVVHQGGTLIELGYDKGQLAQVRVDGHPMLTLEHDDKGRIGSLWTPTDDRFRRHMRYTYSEDGDLVDAKDVFGCSRAYQYEQHLLVREDNRDGGSFFYGYDSFGRAAKCVRTWGTDGYLDRALDYDTSGRTVAVTNSLGYVSTYVLDALGRVTEYTDPVGASTKFRYDRQLRLDQINRSDGTRVRDHYDERGNIIKRTGPGDATWLMRYDEADRLIEATDAGGGRWRYRYDVSGRLARVEDPGEHVIRLEYEDGQLARIVDPLGKVTSVALDAESRVTAVVLPEQGVTKFAYDPMGRMTSVTAADGDRIAWTYDAIGRPLAVQGTNDFVKVIRSPEGRVVRCERPRQTWDAKRDAFGYIQSTTDGTVELSYHFDTEGRLTGAHRDGQPALHLQRDSRGLVTGYLVGDGHETVIGRKSRTTRVERLIRPDRTATIHWDPAGRIASIEDGEGGTSKFSYRGDGLVMSAENAHGTATFERDARGAIVKQTWGELVIDGGPTDFRGRPYGLDIPGTFQMSFLRTLDGDLEGLAIATDKVFDVRVETAADGRLQRLMHDRSLIEIRADGWGRLRGAHLVVGGETTRSEVWDWPRPPADAGDRAEATELPRDALHRAIADDDGRAIVWDEDRMVRCGDRTIVRDPETGRAMAEIDGQTLAFVVPDPVAASPVWSDVESECHAACFPTARQAGALEAVGHHPIEMLRDRFAYRVFDPEVRPVPGTYPWLPDDWAPTLDLEPPPSGRLDEATLMHALGSPFPLPPLTVDLPR